MSILDILNEIAATASTKEKEAIIRREKNNEVLKLVFQAAYNTFITYGIKQIPAYKYDEGLPYPLTAAIVALDNLTIRKYTGGDATSFLQTQLSHLGPDDAIVLERIIGRDLRCGASDTIAAKIWPGLVPTFDVMLAHKDISGITYPAFAQIKSDGMRCHLFFDGVHAQAFSRSGKAIKLFGALDKDAAICMKAGDTFDGELLVRRNGKILDRKTGNGILNKGVKDTISEAEANEVIFVAWDKVDFSGTIDYDVRLPELSTSGAVPFDVASLFQTRKIFYSVTEIVNSEDEAWVFYKKCRAAGEEGAIIKNMKSKWLPKRSKDIGKLKSVKVVDLRIVSWYYGDAGKKFEHGLGGFNCESECGLLKVSVGGGYDEDFRLQDTTVFDDMVGGIMEVTYNEKIQARDGSWSLFLPRVDSSSQWFRVDKKEANTLGEIE
jgi:hypothetical protein